MKIFGIGLSRTGTTSLAAALKQAGIFIDHYPQSHTRLFNSTTDGACDIPVIPFYKQLDKQFVGSRFIYTIRDKESWLTSVERHINRKRPGHQFSKWQQQMRLAVYDCLDFDKNKYSQAFDAHDEDVRTYFKDRPQDLLIVDIVEGEDTQRLKAFLGIEQTIYYQHLNKRK